MNNRKTVLFFSTMLCFISVLKAQNEITINDVLQKAKDACLSLNSIEYKIQQRNAKGKYGRPTINATITQQRANVGDIGFDKAYIKVTGTIKEKVEAEPFSFAYNGDDFTYQRGANKVKKVNNPKRNIVMGMLQQHLFMLRFFPFTQDEPLKSRGGAFKYVGKEEINGTFCYKIKSVTMMRRKDAIDDKKSRPMSTQEIWWIDEETYLPIAFTDGFVYKEVAILNYD